MHARVTCAAAGPWGLITTIENLMAEQAAESVRDFLHFCAQRCLTHAGGGDQALVDAQPDLAGYASDLESSYELFQDAAETMSIAYPDTPRSVLHAPGDNTSYRLVLQVVCSAVVVLGCCPRGCSLIDALIEPCMRCGMRSADHDLHESHSHQVTPHALALFPHEGQHARAHFPTLN